MLSNINSIFFPTDFSKNANQAFIFAAEIALKTGAKLEMVHCVEEPYDFAPMVEEKKEKIVKQVTDLFEKSVSDLKTQKRFKDLKIETKLLSGHPTVNILEESKANPPGLIIMGTKGATDSRNLMFGSLTTEIILHSDVPVLAIPKGTEYNKLKRVLFTTDFHEGDFRAFKNLVEFTGTFKSSLGVVHIARQKTLNTQIKFRGFRELVTETYPDQKIKFHLKYEDDFFSGIADFLVRNPVELLVLVRHKKTFWESLTTRNYSKELGFYSQTPLLVLIGETGKTELSG